MRTPAIFLLTGVLACACGQLDPAAELAAARSSLAEDDYRTAAIHVSNVLQADPENAEGRVLRGRIALARGDFTSAREELERAMRLGTAPEDVALGLADAAARGGDPEAALEALDESRAALEGEAEYWTLRGDALRGAGRADEAGAAYARSAELGPESGRNLVGRAQLAMQRGSPDEAEALFDRAVEAAPDDPEVLSARGAFYLSTGRPEQAAEALQAAADAFESGLVSASEAGVRAMLVQLYVGLSDLDAAAGEAEKLAERAPNAAVSAYAEGLIAYEQGRLDEAARLVQRAVNAQPENQRFLTLLGAVQLGLGNLNQAEQHLLNALNAAPRDPTASRLLAETRLRLERPDAALDSLRPFAADSDDPRFGLLSAAASFRSGDAAEGLQTLERTHERNPDNDDVALQLIRAYLGEGRSDDAERVFDASFGDEASEAALRAELMLLAAAHELGDEARGRERAESLAARFGGQPNALAAVTTYYQLIGDLDAATRHAREALSESPGFGPARVLLARVQLAGENADAARATLREGIERTPDSMQLRAALGALELQQGDVDEAGRIGEALREDFPEQQVGDLLLGEARFAQRRYDEAAAAFGRAYEREPAWRTLNRRIIALQLAGRSGDVEGPLAGWVEDNPEHVDGRVRYAAYLQGVGRGADALEHYERALELDGDHVIALNNAAWLRYELDRPGALGLAERAHELAPDNPAVLDTLGWILVEQNREEDGIVHLERAAESAPQALEIRYHVAQAQARLGRAEDARATLEALLAEEASFAGRDAAEELLESL